MGKLRSFGRRSLGACCVPPHPLPCREHPRAPGAYHLLGAGLQVHMDHFVSHLFPDLPGREQHHAPAVMAKSHSFHFAFPAQGIAVSPKAPSFLKLSFVKCLITAMRKLTVTLSKALLRERNPTHHCLSGFSPRDAAGHPCC